MNDNILVEIYFPVLKSGEAITSLRKYIRICNNSEIIVDIYDFGFTKIENVSLSLTGYLQIFGLNILYSTKVQNYI